jgi:penicillin amidase
MRRLLRFASRLALALVVLLVLAVGFAWWTLHRSLPQLDGELALPGLSAPVRIERDALGTVTIDAANEADAARALGFVHGQERFFEMDLLRRSAAGELSALFGPIAVDTDKSIRVHRMRARVDASLGAVAGAHLPALQAYSAGVNAGRRALATRPWPYLLLRAEPEDWRPADSLLAGYAMFFDLQDESNSRELALWRIRQSVPPALYRLIAADGTEWDAPLLGEPRGNVPLPGAEELDLRTLPTPAAHGPVAQSEEAAPGSNNFAVDGTLTADGRAIVADDMHLTLRAPNLWFRARLRYADAKAPGGRVDVTGFTLPGIPAVIVGSNTHVAWAFTNSYGDWADFVRVPTRCIDRLETYENRHPAPHPCDPRMTTKVTETIQVKGGDPVALEVEQIAWDNLPIVATDLDGTRLALDWMAHHAGSLDLGLADLARAGDVEQALYIAREAGMPQQNFVVADAKGRIGWTITGKKVVRGAGCDPTRPMVLMDDADVEGASPLVAQPEIVSPFDAPPPARDADASRATAPCSMTLLGYFDARPAPLLASPAVDRLWTANARTLDGAALARIGDAGYANGARARQIRDDLRAKPKFAERDLLAIQVDDRALFLERWWKLLRAQAAADGGDGAWRKLAAATTTWDGRASATSVNYRVVRAWRLAVLDRIKTGLTAPAAVKLGDDFVMPDLPQIEGVGWELVTRRPPHLLPRRYESWDALLRDAADEVVVELEKSGPVAQRTWGERNTAAICHPLARALPRLLGERLCMPADALDGDANMPRVVAPDFGASERMVVSPGHEADGIVHMPGGQSGHPLSPFWGAGHAAWVHGEATPFLPGKARYVLTAKP